MIVKLSLVWLCLLGLLTITAVSAWFPLGPWNSVINLAVAAAKMLLIAAVYMELRRGEPLMRFAAIAGLAFLAILIGLSGADFRTRHTVAAPWSALTPWRDAP